MKKNLLSLSRLFAGFILMPLAGFGQIAYWSVDFAGSAFTGAGAIGTPTDNWDHFNTDNAGFSGTLTQLGSGTHDPVTLTMPINSRANNGTWFPADAGDLMNSYIFGARSFTLSGLDPALSYNLILYAGTDANNKEPSGVPRWYRGSFTIDNGNGTQATGKPPFEYNDITDRDELLPNMPLTEGVHYVKFSDITPWDLGGGVFGITGSIADTTTGNTTVWDPATNAFVVGRNLAVWNGFQLEAIPEPSTFLSILFGLAALRFIRRRRN